MEWPGSVRYRVECRLKRGGEGEIFKAKDQILGRWVALKRLRLDSEESGERLVREARLQARLSHRNICPIYDTGWQDGYAFIVLPYVEGPGLLDWVNEMSVLEKTALIRDVAAALEAAHQDGLIHGDIKPGNILLSVDKDGKKTALLSDFGLARLMAEECDRQSSDAILGSPQYMSPEQVEEDPRPADMSSDIFSLGAMAFEILGGRPAFDGKTYPQIIEQISRCNPPSLRTLDRRISPDLEAVIMKCLARKPSQRYASVGEMIADIDNVLQGRSVRARPLSFWHRQTRRALKNKPFLLSAASSVFFLIVFLALLVHNQRDAARLAEVASRFGREIEEIGSIMRQAYLMPPHPIINDLSEVRRRLVQLELEVVQDGKDQNGAGHFALGRGYYILRDLEKARRYLEKAKSLGFSHETVSVELAEVLGELYNRNLRWVERQPDSEVRTYQRRKLEREYLAVSRSLLEYAGFSKQRSRDIVLARLAFYQGDIDTSMEHIARARRSDARNYEVMMLEGDILQLSGESVWNEGQTEEALKLYKEAVVAYDSAREIGRSDPLVYLRLGQIFEKCASVEISTRGRDVELNLKRAESYCRQALEIDPHRIETLIALAAVHYRQGEYVYSMQKDPSVQLDQVEMYSRQVLALDPNDADAWRIKGLAFMRRGRFWVKSGHDPRSHFTTAASCFERAIALNPNDPSLRLDLVWTHVYHGYQLTNVGVFAEDVLRRAVSSARELSAAFPDLGRAYESLGGANYFLSHYLHCRGVVYHQHCLDSVDAYRKALALNPETVQTYNSLVISILALTRGGGSAAKGQVETHNELLELIGRGLALNSELPVLHNCLGLVYADMALEELESGRNPDSFLVRMNEAFLRGERLGQRDVLASQYGIMAFRMRAQWSLWSGIDAAVEIDEVDRLYKSGKSINPVYLELDNEYASFLLVSAEKELLKERDPEALLTLAENLLKKALQIKGDHAFAQLLMARCHILKAFWHMVVKGSVPDGDLKRAEALLQGEWNLPEVLYRRGLMRVQMLFGRVLSRPLKEGTDEIELDLLTASLELVRTTMPNRVEGRFWNMLIGMIQSSSEPNLDVFGRQYAMSWLSFLRRAKTVRGFALSAL